MAAPFLRNIETQTGDQPVQKFIKKSPKKTGHRIAITEKDLAEVFSEFS